MATKFSVFMGALGDQPVAADGTDELVMRNSDGELFKKDLGSVGTYVMENKVYPPNSTVFAPLTAETFALVTNNVTAVNFVDADPAHSIEWNTAGTLPGKRVTLINPTSTEFSFSGTLPTKDGGTWEISSIPAFTTMVFVFFAGFGFILEAEMPNREGIVEAQDGLTVLAPGTTLVTFTNITDAAEVTLPTVSPATSGKRIVLINPTSFIVDFVPAENRPTRDTLNSIARISATQTLVLVCSPGLGKWVMESKTQNS